MQSIWYRFWKIMATLGMKMYFSKIKVAGLSNVPNSGPVILAVNHQNSFLDAIIVACVIKRKSYFLARGDVFRRNWAHAMLSSIGIMPIYRFRDGHGKVKDNEAIFEACSNILIKDGMVMIFPEGNHYMKWFLRPLQRGIARIAFQSQAKDESKPIHIVPVGLQYEDHTNAASRILINIGTGLDVKNYYKVESDERSAMDNLIKDLFKIMKPLVLNIPEEGYEEYIKKLYEHRIVYSDLQKQLASDQQIIDDLISNPNQIPAVARKQSLSFSRFVIYPLVPIGWLTHILPRLLIGGIIRKTVKDPQFIAPLNFALGMVLYPANALIWGVMIGVGLGSFLYGAGGGLLIILIGKLTIKYWH